MAVLAQARAMAVPTILNVSPTQISGNSQGDVVFLQGDSFGTSPTVEYSWNSNNWITVSPVAEGNNYVSVRIPGGTINLLTVRVSPDGVNWSAPAFINLPQAMSYDTGQIASGSAFRIFGRNLYLGSGTPTVQLVDRLTLQSYAATVQTSTSTGYILWVVAPMRLAVGHSYSVYVSNGFSGSGAFGTGVVLAAEPLVAGASASDVWLLGTPWGGDYSATYNNVYNVVTDPRLLLHAVGNGVNNDQPAIQNAINIANAAGGGVVYLPAGTYKLVFNPNTTTGAIELLSNVVLDGAGNGLSTVDYGYGTPSPNGWEGFGLTTWNCWNPVSRVGVANLSLVNVNSSWTQNFCASAFSQSNELFFKNVSFSSDAGNMMGISNITNVAIENSSFTELGGNSGDVMLGNPANFILRDNTMTWSAGQVLNFLTAHDGVVEGNTFTRNCNYAVNPQYPNTRCFDINFIKNIEILNNTFNVTGGVVNDTYNDGETILSEVADQHLSDLSTGTMTSATSTSISDTSKTWAQTLLQTGSVVAVVSGIGTGQWRTITAVTPTSLTVSPAWAVPPMAGSRYSVFDWGAQNWLIDGNNLTANRAGIDFYMVAATNLAIVDNSLTNNEGITLHPCQNNGTPNVLNMFVPQWNCQVVGNNVVDNSKAEPAFIGAVFDQIQSPTTLGTGVLGVELRNNIVTGYSRTSFAQSGTLPGTEGYYNYCGVEGLPTAYVTGVPAVLGTILQGNTASNCNLPYRLDSGVLQTTLADPVQHNCNGLVDDTLISPAKTGSYGTIVDYQAEAGIISPGAHTVSDLTASGQEVVGQLGTVGRNITFDHIDGGGGGTHPLFIHYSWPNATSTDLYVNGVLIKSVSLPATATVPGSSVYGTVTVPVTLKAGCENVLMLRTDSGNGGVNLDKITVG
jgi:hypothetical protein